MAAASAMFASQLTYRSLKFDEAAWRAARHVLHVDASHGAGSVLAHGAEALFAELARTHPETQVEHVRLWDEGVRAQMDYSLEHVRSKMAMLAGSAGEQDEQRFAMIERLSKQVASARGLVVSAPMWNYGVPYVAKQYFDCVLHPGLTFRELSGGRTEGLLGGDRPLVILTSSGGDGARDHLTPWLTDVGAMLGFDRVAIVAAPHVAHASRDAVLEMVARQAMAAARHLAGGALQEAGEEAPARGGDDGEPKESAMDMDKDGLIGWLQTQGGLSDDCLETVRAARVNGELFRVATEEDWRSEEFDLGDEDVKRILELQEVFRTKIGDVVGAFGAPDR